MFSRFFTNSVVATFLLLSLASTVGAIILLVASTVGAVILLVASTVGAVILLVASMIFALKAFHTFPTTPTSPSSLFLGAIFLVLTFTLLSGLYFPFHLIPTKSNEED